MSATEPQSLPPEATQGLSTASTTIVRAELGMIQRAALHPHVRSLVKEAVLRSGQEVPDLEVLLKLVSQQFEAMDAERRGIVQSMRLMADEAAELAYQARESELTERVVRAEREVFEQLTANVPLAEALSSVTHFIESVGIGTVGAISVLADDRHTFGLLIAPKLAEPLRAALERCAIDIHNGSCAAAVSLGRQVLVADVAKDPFWERPRAAILAAGLNASWSTLIKATDGRVLGSLGVYHATAGLPGQRELRIMAHAAQIAGIAIGRFMAEWALRASEAKFRGLFETIVEGVYQSGPEGRLESVNPAFVSILGYDSPEQLYALRDVAALYWNREDRARFTEQIERQGEIRNAEFVLRRRDGAPVVVLENGRAVRDAAGRIIGYEGTIADITERKRAEQEVFAEKERAQVTLQSIGDAVISTDADGRIDYINPAAENLAAWRLDEARGKPIGEVLRLIDEISREPIDNPLLRVLGKGRSNAATEHAVLVTRAGHEVAIQETAAPICDRQGRVIGAVMVFHDVTRERRLKRALSYQASHDALTGLINRREFDNRLQQAVMSARHGGLTHALLYIDLDQFKVVNDTCGHQAGDRLLRDITGLLQSRVRAADIIARLGGDEFGVLLENCSIEQSTRIAEGVRQAIHTYRFSWGTSTLSVGASVGVVHIGAETESVASVMSAADIACYAAKEAGRNRIHFYESDGQNHPRHREMHWVARVTRAVEQNCLELYFQPIRPLAQSQEGINFNELLVRLRDEDGRLVPPEEFIPAAERYNVISVIDRWVVRHALEFLGEWRRGGAPLPLLAINVSGTSLNDQSFIDFTMQHVEDTALAAALCFEITETAAVTSLSNAAFAMHELKARGCKFALDDFGTGLSSFMYLKSLPVDFLKIDGQFVRRIAEDPVDRSMVEAICKVGRTLGIATVAEFVETQPVLDELRRIGVDYAQGFLLANPLPIAQLRP